MVYCPSEAGEATKNRLRIAASVFFAVLTVALCVLWVGTQSVGSRAHKIVPGMSAQQVREIMGEPDTIEDPHNWTYDAEMRMGWVGVNFDDNGRVRGMNDETAYPW